MYCYIVKKKSLKMNICIQTLTNILQMFSNYCKLKAAVYLHSIREKWLLFLNDLCNNKLHKHKQRVSE